jgi:hypothetical protein
MSLESNDYPAAYMLMPCACPEPALARCIPGKRRPGSNECYFTCTMSMSWYVGPLMSTR